MPTWSAEGEEKKYGNKSKKGFLCVLKLAHEILLIIVLPWVEEIEILKKKPHLLWFYLNKKF